MSEQLYCFSVSAPFEWGSQNNNLGRLSEEIVNILDFYHSDIFAEQPKCEDRTSPSRNHYERLLTNLVDKADYPLERKAAELKAKYPAPIVFVLRRVYALDAPCTINGDEYTRIEVEPEALKHYREYFTAKKLTGFEEAAERAIRYIVASLCGKTLKPLEPKTATPLSYEVRSVEENGVIKVSKADERTELEYGTASQGLLAIEIPSYKPNRESRFHLRPAEKTIFFYHLLEMSKPKWTRSALYGRVK